MCWPHKDMPRIVLGGCCGNRYAGKKNIAGAEANVGPSRRERLLEVMQKRYEAAVALRHFFPIRSTAIRVICSEMGCLNNGMVMQRLYMVQACAMSPICS